MKTKTTLEESKEEFIKRGYIPLFEKYKNCDEKLLAKTKEGYKVTISLSGIKYGYTPHIVDVHNPYSIENIKLWIKINNLSYELLSSEYVNASDKLTCKCLIDNNIFYIAWRHIKRKIGCSKCAIRNNKGENNPSWKGGITPLHEYLRHRINQWKQDSFKKYNYKCDIRKIYDKTILIHHVSKNFSEILQETVEVLQLPIYKQINMYTDEELKNIEEKCLELHYKYGLGVCLCEEEHKLFHKLYSRENNTLEQYWEFKENRLKELTQFNKEKE